MVGPGTDIHALRPLRWLLERGCQVTFCDATNPFPSGQAGYTYKPFPEPRGCRWLHRPGGRRLASLYAAITVPPKLKRLWRDVQPDITHVHWVDAHSFHCARAGIRPLVLSVWGSDINRLLDPDAGSLLKYQVGYALRAADRVLIDSADMHDKCARIAKQPVATELFNLGVDTTRFRPGYQTEAAEWRHTLGVTPETTVFLSMRGWSPLYRHATILEAFAAALPRFRSPAVLVFKVLQRSSADRAAYEKQMRELAAELGVSGHLRWMGEVPMSRLPEIYAMADAIVNYPSMDAFPVTFLEAAASERPVISGRLPAYDGTFAERYFNLVSSDDVTALADAMVDFASPSRRTSPAKLAELRRLIIDQFDERLVADRLLRLYQTLETKCLR